LVEEQSLPERYKDHMLIDNYLGRRECHLEPNWLLIYKKDENTLVLERLGTHSDLFKN
jgi:mRNA interferase YafQ